MLDIIAPADAFRLLLCARYRRTTLRFANKINSYAWFWHPKRLGVPLCVNATARAVNRKLCQHVREGDIRLRGELRKQDFPVDIDQADRLLGELDFFAQTLTIHGQGLTIDRVYRRVFFIKSDVMKIVEEFSKESFLSASVVCGPALKWATDGVIRNAIGAVYDDADKDSGPRPNINKLPGAVRPRLAAVGYQASDRQIKRIGREFADRRGKVGVRLTRQAVPK